MKSNTGIVMQLDKKHAFIMTETGEFLKVKLNRNIPKIGEIFTGEISSKYAFYKYAAAAASLIFVLLSGSGAYAYYSPAASILVNINPSVKLQVNRWDRVIKSIPLNEDGIILLKDLNLKNNSINSALDKIIDESKKDNFINKDYIESGKTITIAVEDNKLKKDFNLSQFEEHAKENKLNIKIIKDPQVKSQTEEIKSTETKGSNSNTPNNSQNTKNSSDEDNSKGNSDKNSSTEFPKNNNSSKSETDVNKSKNSSDKNNQNLKKDTNISIPSKDNNSDKQKDKEKPKEKEENKSKK